MSNQSNSPEQLRILLAEDNKDWIATITAIAEESGAMVVAVAETFVEAFDQIQQVNDLHINLIVLGGNLDGESLYAQSNIRLLFEMLKQINPDIPSISLSGDLNAGKELTMKIGKTGRWAEEFKTALTDVMTGNYSKSS